MANVVQGGPMAVARQRRRSMPNIEPPVPAAAAEPPPMARIATDVVPSASTLVMSALDSPRTITRSRSEDNIAITANRADWDNWDLEDNFGTEVLYTLDMVKLDSETASKKEPGPGYTATDLTTHAKGSSSRSRASSNGGYGGERGNPEPVPLVRPQGNKRLTISIKRDDPKWITWSAEQWDSSPAPERERTKEILSPEKRAAQAKAMEQVSEIAAKLRSEIEEKGKRRQERRKKRCSTTPAKAWSTVSYRRQDTRESQESGDSGQSSPPVSNKSAPATYFDKMAKLLREDVIIFDWDDTLFPTTYVNDIVKENMNGQHGMLPEDSPYRDDLAEHAIFLTDFLQKCTQMASVYIVTLASKSWVDNSCNWYLPGLEWREISEQLGIKTLYARECLSQRDERACRVEDGVCVFTLAKRNAMRKVFKDLRKINPALDETNVLAVGDSSAEIEAIQEIMWSVDADRSLCKTVQLLSDPSLTVLSSQLQVLVSWLPPLMAYDQDATVNMDNNPNASEVIKMLMEATCGPINNPS